MFVMLACIFMSQGVTLGGTGKETGDRHPNIGDGALLGACVTILGNIRIGAGAMVPAGSLVLKDVPSHRYETEMHLKDLLEFFSLIKSQVDIFLLGFLKHGGWKPGETDRVC